MTDEGHLLILVADQDQAAAFEITRDRGERLIDLMGECRAHLAERRKP